MLWSCFSVQSLRVFASGHIKYTFHCTSQADGLPLLRRRRHFKMTIFLTCGQLIRHPIIELFHLFNLLQMPNHHRMVYVEFFGNFSCSCKRISFDDGAVGCCQLPMASSSSRLSSPLQNFLNHSCTVCSLVVPGPNVSLMLKLSPPLYDPS